MFYSMFPDPRRRRTFSNGQLVGLIIVVLLVLLGSGSLVYTTVTNQTAATNASGTATVLTSVSHTAFAETSTAGAAFNATATAQANMLATTQAYATVTAIANATAMANANATATANARASAIAAANATASAQAYAGRDPYPPYTGKLVLDDPLSNNSQGHGWDVYSQPGNYNCQFAGGAYESTTQNQVGNYYDIGNICIAENTNFKNFAFQVDMTLLKGDCGGLAFRGKTNNMYAFVICSNAVSSGYDFRVISAGTYIAYRKDEYSPAIHRNYGQMNVLAVVAIGSTFTLYANGQELTTVTDSSFSAGQIGLVSSGYNSVLDVATFRTAEVWTL